MIKGKAITYGKNIDTDQIIGARHLILPTIADMAPYAFEHYRNFTAHFRSGDILVAEENFGCGSSREQAPAVLKQRGVGAIVACSFARIFFRNAINLGLPLFVCAQAAEIGERAHLEIDGAWLRDVTAGRQYTIEPLPPFIVEIVESGGIIPYLQKKGGSGLE
jgi:3-isopropylmalate dehydratase small subunit